MIHQLKEAKGREATTKCGQTVKVSASQRMCEVATIWHRDVTCEECKR